MPQVAACALVWMGLFGAATIVRAQEATASPQQAPVAADRPRAEPPTRLYFTLWTLHLKDDKPGLDNNWAIGLATRGWFGATFLNSYRRRGYAAGLQRTVLSKGDASLGASLGYRLGIVTGYDGRLMKFARNKPVLPLIQPFFVLDVAHFGVEASYTFVVASTAVSYRF